jgi:tRNA-specific 2-thiouridylase
VQLRAHGEVHRATVSPHPGGLAGDLLRITLDRPARGVATGQAAVLYDGDTVLGSGTISRTRAVAATAAEAESAR